MPRFLYFLNHKFGLESIMKKMMDIQNTLRQQKPFLARKYGVKEIGIFGSYVRGDQKRGSDIDILVELEKPIRIDLIAFIEMENYLSDLIGIKVDLVIKEDLKPRISKNVLNELVSV